MAAILAAILDAGDERPPELNFIETHRTIEKSKETIDNRPNKVMGHATGLLCVFSEPRAAGFRPAS